MSPEACDIFHGKDGAADGETADGSHKALRNFPAKPRSRADCPITCISPQEMERAISSRGRKAERSDIARAESRFVADGVRVPGGFLLDDGADERGSSACCDAMARARATRLGGGDMYLKREPEAEATSRRDAGATKTSLSGGGDGSGRPSGWRGPACGVQFPAGRRFSREGCKCAGGDWSPCP